MKHGHMIRASSFVVALTAAANECAVEYAKQGPCDIDAHELGLPCAWRDGKCKDLKWQHATSRASPAAPGSKTARPASSTVHAAPRRRRKLRNRLSNSTDSPVYRPKLGTITTRRAANVYAKEKTRGSVTGPPCDASTALLGRCIHAVGVCCGRRAGTARVRGDSMGEIQSRRSGVYRPAEVAGR